MEPKKKKKKKNKTAQHKRKFSEKTARQMYADDATAAYVSTRPETNFKRTPVSDADVIGEAVAMAKKKKKKDDKAAMDHFKKTGLPFMSKEDEALLESMKNKGGYVKKYAKGGGVRAARF